MCWHCVTLQVQAFLQSPEFSHMIDESDILTEFEVNLGIIIEKYDKT